MQLCMYRRDSSDPTRLGLCTADGTVYDFLGAVTAAGVDLTGAETPVDVLGVIRDWDRLGGPVLAAMAAIDDDPGLVPRESAAQLTSPFPRPLRDAFAIGGNYRQHVEAASKTTGLALNKRKNPVFFMKPIGTFSGPHDDVEVDTSFTQRLDYEVELGVVLGKGGRDISRESAMDHVFGYLVVNDFSARDIMLQNSPQVDHFRGKGLDTFFPMGPGVTPRDLVPEYRDLRLLLHVNGDLKQDAVAGDMTRDIPQIIAELSRSMSLYAGDIIATGTPAGVAQESPDPVFLQDGDVVETAIEGLGVLVNRVRERRPE